MEGNSTSAPLLRRSRSAYLNRLAGSSPLAGLPAPELEGYTPEHVAFAARAWTMKAEEEYRSTAVFTEIVGGLLELGAPVDLLAALGQVVQDEIAHTTLCYELALQFQAPPATASVERAKPRLETTSSERPRRALALLLFEGAVGETVSSTLFHAGRRGAREPCTRAALGMILRDEARHARLSWYAMAELLPQCSAETREWLQRDLARSFASFEQSVALPALRRLEAGEVVAPELVSLGVIHPEARVETFYHSIERVVLPRLARLGFDGERAWAERYRI